VQIAEQNPANNPAVNRAKADRSTPPNAPPVAALLEIAALAAAQLQRGQGRWRGGSGVGANSSRLAHGPGVPRTCPGARGWRTIRSQPSIAADDCTTGRIGRRIGGRLCVHSHQAKAEEVPAPVPARRAVGRRSALSAQEACGLRNERAGRGGPARLPEHALYAG